jgi:UDP-N-acetylmuramyl tripeptide synthase
VRLEVEMALARAAGGISRLAGRGGGTTLPGKILERIDPGAIPRLAAGLRHGSVAISATNGKTTTASVTAEILGGRFRLAHNAAGANLVSGVTSALIGARDAELGLFEVDEAALPEVVRLVSPRVVSLGNLFRDQLDRYGELELVAERWRDMAAELDPRAALVVNGDDPLVAEVGGQRGNVITFGIDDPRSGGPTLQHAADSKYCVVCGAPYVYAAAYVGHLGDYCCPACGHGRPELDVVARSIELDGLRGVRFDLAMGAATRGIRLQLPGVHNVYNALAAAAVARAAGATLDEISEGLERASPAFGRFERIEIGDRAVRVLLIKNPAGANETIRTLLQHGSPTMAVVALNDGIADGRDVSWIWDVDFEPLLARLSRVVCSGERAGELALRFAYGGMRDESIEVISDLGDALDRGLELTAPESELVFLPTYTAMLELQSIVAGRGYVRPYWERAA